MNVGLSITQTSIPKSKVLSVRRSAVWLIALFLSSALAFSATPQSQLLQKAREAFLHAQELESALNDKAPEERTRNQYVKVRCLKRRKSRR